MSSLDLGLIGNCGFAALVDRRARIVWACLPRFDGDPVFCSLLDGGRPQDGDETGVFAVDVEDLASSEQAYLHNSAVLRTVLTDARGGSLEVIDFAPRFRRFERAFRPTSVVRLLRPLTGRPRIRVRLRPRFGYGTMAPQVTRGSNHVRYVGPTQALRLTTDLPVSFVMDETWFLLEGPATLVFGADEPLAAALQETALGFLDATNAYWRDYARYLALPFEWQEAVIRAAITLKLCTFEETGAVVAAVTTSIPEHADSGRTWDYRFCWLRDAYFVIHALNRLGATKTMEDYLRYIGNVVASVNDGPLQPVYGISLDWRLTEWHAEGLTGYRGMGPVRVGNQAYAQVQNDSYGAVVMAATQMFFDLRLSRTGGLDLFRRLEGLGDRAVELFGEPDAGLWEFRTMARRHTFSAVMCWAACDRLARIARRLGLADREAHWRGAADRLKAEIVARAYDPAENAFKDAFDDGHADASLLLLHELGFVSGDDPRFAGTVAYIEKHLRRGRHLLRYAAPDDFGEPKTAFNICTFWFIDALAATGRRAEARELFEEMLACRNHLGLLSEDIDPVTGELWGNYPQTYSMVGLINSALRLSRPWEGAI
jgi:GH15 family glucan-1,4-alpha-glucosidase